MPITLRSLVQSSVDVTDRLRNVSYRYRYPIHANLKPGTPMHDKLRDHILERAYASSNSIKKRHDSWRKNDEMLTGYIESSEAEQRVQAADPNKPIDIVIPAMYAVLDTLLSYMTAAFIHDPIFRYRGTGPEDTLGALLMEKIVQLQCHKSQAALKLYTMWRDAFVYGVGAVALSWDVKHGKRTRTKEVYRYGSAEASLYEDTPELVSESRREDVILYEGNTMDNIDPYTLLPDPNQPLHDIQRGEFIGWFYRSTLFSLLQEEHQDDAWFNARYLKHVDGRSAFMEELRGEDDRRYGPPELTQLMHPVDVTVLYETLIPKDWGLSNNSYPEKWFFALAGDSILIQATPLDLDHGLYPIVTCVPDYDGYSTCPISRLELLFPMQRTLNWFVNSHIKNVRKSLNDMLIVNPSLLNMHDFSRPGPGKIIRMRPSAWNQDIDKAAMQLPVVDVTRQHMGDMAVLFDTINRVSGAVDNAQGVPRQHGERVSALEAQKLNSGAMGKFERLARTISVMAHQPIAIMYADHIQQFSNIDQYVRFTTGEWTEELERIYGVNASADFSGQRYLRTTPSDLQIDYDIIVHDGSIPTVGDAPTMNLLFQTAVQDPELRQRYDITRMFGRIAQMVGFKNMQDFLRTDVQAQVQPTEDVRQQAQQGNLVALSGGAQ